MLFAFLVLSFHLSLFVLSCFYLLGRNVPKLERIILQFGINVNILLCSLKSKKKKTSGRMLFAQFHETKKKKLFFLF